MFTDDEKRQVLAMLDASGIGELLFDDGRLRVELSRAAPAPAAPDPCPAVQRSGPEPDLVPSAIRAPAAGSFRSNLAVGTTVTASSIVGTIEAAGRSLSVVAGRVGRVAGVFAQDGDFVEHGQLLFMLMLETRG